jgi:hypothetical protein
LIWEKGVDIAPNHVDCGEIIYNVIEDEFQGGSGAGCSAVVFNSYIMDKLKRKEINRVLFVATGALLSTVSSGQGESIPCISHAVAVENAQTLAKNVYTTQAELDAAVQQIATVKALLRSADDISDKNMLVSVTSRSTQVLRGQTVTLSVVASERISGVEIYDDLDNRVAVDQFVPVANSTDERDIVVLQFIESTPGSRTYRVYAVDAEGKRSADYLECSVTCY